VTADGRVFGYEVFVPPPSFGRVYAFQLFTWTAAAGMSSVAPIYGVENFAIAVDSSSGQLVGYSCNDSSRNDCRAFSWTASGGSVDMTPAGPGVGSCYPYDVNGQGQAAGYCNGNPDRAFIWSAGTGMQFLVPATAGAQCYAEGLNDSGQVVRNCVSGSERFGFSWTSDVGMVEIRVQGSTNSYARHVNGSGQVAGQTALGQAWIWTEQDGISLIAGVNNGWSVGLLGLTESGHVIGYTTQVAPTSGPQYAFAWRQGDGLSLLYLEQGANSYPRAWNAAGQVTGAAVRNNLWGAFVWTPGKGIVALDPIPEPVYNSPCADAFAINARGQVAGVSCRRTYNEYRSPAVLWNARPVSRTPLVLAVPDASADGITDIGVLRDRPIRVEVRSGQNSALVRTIGFLDDSVVPLAVQSMLDTDGNGIAEIAVLAARRSDDRGVVEIRNVSGPQAVRQVWFAAGQTPVSLAVIADDADNNGVAELAVLSRRNSDGRGLVEVKNAFGTANTRAIWMAAGFSPRDLEVVEDADHNGVPEVAVLATRDSDGRIVAEVELGGQPLAPNSVWFMAGHSAVDLAVVDDADGNTIPELAVLSSRNSDGRNVVEIKNAAGATAANAVWFALGNSALAVKSMADADGNSVPEVLVLATRDSDGRAIAEVKNAAGTANGRALWYPTGYSARDLAILPDLDNNGIAEAGALLMRATDGRIVVESRNASSTQAPRDYWFSP
jgi:hypothetical protein